MATFGVAAAPPGVAAPWKKLGLSSAGWEGSCDPEGAVTGPSLPPFCAPARLHANQCTET